VLPQPARQAILEHLPAPYEPIAVFAGETEAVHKAIEAAPETAENCKRFDCSAIEEKLSLIEEKLNRLRTVHVGSREWEQIQGDAADKKSAFYRKKQINQFLYDAPYYLQGIRELLPHLSGDLLLYSKTNFLFSKTTLLLEQSLLALIAYFDIPSQEGGDQHALLDKVGGNNRPRYFDHDIFRSLELLESYLKRSFPERWSAAKMRTFLATDQRYLTTDTTTEFGIIMNEVRSLGALSASLNEGFLSKKQRDRLKKMFGEKREEWKSGFADKIGHMQEKTLGPLAEELLALTNTILDISLKEREQKWNRVII
jgi:hypothetical protein